MENNEWGITNYELRIMNYELRMKMEESTDNSKFVIRNSVIRGTRQGSALLIVLGMLSFMVVSAVAFSIFMRQGRLPSSFLRQRILSRELVKAGLAQAMTEIDQAIGSAQYPRDEFQGASDRNYWKNRVLMGVQIGSSSEYGAYRTPKGSYVAYTQKDDDDGLPYEQTVSTFPLEGLAYIPPPLVNTVRYWARHTPTAQWKPLNYDSGRYAFTAVNVSDYLDINRLRANVLRDSSPSNRISLAFLLENDAHNGWRDPKITPKAFDKKMDDVAASTYGRLVSLADYNLALDSGGQLEGSGFKSPFCEYIRNPPGDGSFYGANEDQAKMQKFITDSWYPPVKDGKGETPTVAYLTDPVKGQPFYNVDQSLDRLRKKGNEAFEAIADHLDLCSLAALYDYVDDDDVPISLAVPTLERTPMLTGIRISPANIAVTLDMTETLVPGAASGANKRRTFSIKSLGDGPIIRFTGCGVFPFKRKSGSDMTPLAYKAQVLVRLFFSDAAIEETRANGVSFRPTSASWQNEDALFATDKGYVTLVGEAPVNFTYGALEDSGTTFGIGPIELAIPNSVNGAHVYGYLQKYKLVDGSPVEDEAVFDPTEMAKPLTYRSGAAVRNLKDAGEGGMPLRLTCMCWVRIIDALNNTVDLVPATLSDDQLYNGHKSVGSIEGGTDDLAGICGSKEPQMPLSTDVVLQMDLQRAKQGGAQPTPAQLGSLMVYCDDPRFNYAPEDWYAVSGDVDANTWLSAARNRCDGNDRRSADLFQFVSDQGYLQSMGELQFLPYLRNFKPGDQISGSFYNSGKYNGTPFATRTGPEQLANRDFAWKTHWGFGQYADWRDGEGESGACPYDWGLKDTDGGVAVNPFADEDLFMAALANTPYDYAVASEKAQDSPDRDFEQGLQLCFRPGGSEAALDWTKLKEVATVLRQNFLTGKEWEKWDDWNPDGGQIWEKLDGGSGASKLHDVDCKFLFSYWKECFANNQQLFLVFVRAEPTVIGGSSAGHTPSQLGARAVALVWREPVSSLTAQNGESDPPHRMRILFYHQFE